MFSKFSSDFVRMFATETTTREKTQPPGEAVAIPEGPARRHAEATRSAHNRATRRRLRFWTPRDLELRVRPIRGSASRNRLWHGGVRVRWTARDRSSLVPQASCDDRSSSEVHTVAAHSRVRACSALYNVSRSEVLSLLARALRSARYSNLTLPYSFPSQSNRTLNSSLAIALPPSETKILSPLFVTKLTSNSPFSFVILLLPSSVVNIA